MLHESKLSKFRTLHWWEVDEAGHVATLHRGMSLVSSEAVTSARLKAAIDELAAYIAYRQRPDGAFTCVYDPTIDLYATEDDAAMQAGASWALTARAASDGDRATVEAAEKALAALAARAVKLPPAENAAIVPAPDGNQRAAITAQACLALCAAPGQASAGPVLERLLHGLLWLQQPDGRFLSVFPPTVTPDVPDRAAGQILLALARAYERRPQARLIEAIDQAFAHYRKRFAET